MVNGLNTFKDYFKDYSDQYVLIGGTACDIVFRDNNALFRSTRDLDIVLIIEAISLEFVEKLWCFIKEGEYQNKATNGKKPQFYRFTKPKDDTYPKMIELFSRSDFKLHGDVGITPIHVDDEVSSLSAILLNEDYYKILLSGKTIINNLSVLRPEYLILFKAKAYLDLKQRKENGEAIDSKDIKKHKKDILRIILEILLEHVDSLPVSVENDIHIFIESLYNEPFDLNLLKNYGLKNEDVINALTNIFE